MPGSSTLSFRTRLTVRWTVVFSCLLAAASVSIYAGIRAASYAELDRQLRTLAGTEVASAFDQPVSPHVHELPTTALTGGTFTEKLVQVFDANGRLVVASDGRARELQFVPPGAIDAAVRGEAPITNATAGGLPIRVIVLGKSYKGDNYAFAVGVVTTDFLAGLRRVKWLLAIVWCASTIATAAVGFAMASTALRPVRHITERAMTIAATDIRARLEAPVVNDEIGAMARSLNVLLERLHAALDANRRFAADAAHELRSPVTAMAGEIDVALRRDRPADEYRETLVWVRHRLSALSSIIGDLMLLVRAQESNEPVSPQELSLTSLVNSAVARVMPTAQARGVAVESRLREALWTYGEAGLLGRVFDNVLENAVRYNRENGTVTIDAAFTDSAVESWEPGRITLRITDTGPGIPESEHEQVFDRFYRVDASRNRHTGGAGLGLAIAREVLALFRGTIAIGQSSRHGTTVVIEMPGRRQQPHAVPESWNARAAGAV